MEVASKASRPSNPVSMAKLATSEDARSKFKFQTMLWFKDSGLIWPKAMPVVPGPKPRIGFWLSAFLVISQVAELDSWSSIGSRTELPIQFLGLIEFGRNWKPTNRMLTTKTSKGFQIQLDDCCWPDRTMDKAR